MLYSLARTSTTRCLVPAEDLWAELTTTRCVVFAEDPLAPIKKHSVFDVRWDAWAAQRTMGYLVLAEDAWAELSSIGAWCLLASPGPNQIPCGF